MHRLELPRFGGQVRAFVVGRVVANLRRGQGQGSVGDSCDAMAESIIGLCKAEVGRLRRPWRGLEEVEFATLEWVVLFNHRRLLETIEIRPTTEA